MLGQTFEFRDLATILMLILLEGVLSIDNALVLGMIARRVEPKMRMRALSFGLVGALIFRLIAVGLAAYLLKWSIVKLLGGIYLVYVSVEYFIGRARRHRHPALTDTHHGFQGFWKTVGAIELTDVAFAVDSILAAVAMVGGAPVHGIHPKLWVIVTGGMLGVVLMRFAAAIFIKLLEKFPGLNRSAYLLVVLIGMKLIVDFATNAWKPGRVDFQDMRRPPF